MKFWERVSGVDRRILYAVLALAVVLPLFFRPRPSARVSAPVRDAYNAIDTLAPGSVVVISIDYDPSSAPELQPMMLALLRHCFSRNLKVIITAQLALGLPLGDAALGIAAPEHGKSYGTDYVNIGYRPGGGAVMLGIGRELRGYFSTDTRDVPVDSFEFMRRVHNYRDIAVVVSLAHGAVADWWVQYVGARFNEPIVVGCTGVNVSSMFPYYKAGQIAGLLAGMQGAAEYESLVGRPDKATKGMLAQSVAHALIIALLVVGNVGFLLSRRRKAKA
ncbi:hypothetical protein FJY71_01060 [candidate division WOR-3 bacterium]|nr:hypothetical protein [candidate division WOR-3 bacterium]